MRTAAGKQRAFDTLPPISYGDDLPDMPPSNDSRSFVPTGAAQFVTTHWSMVLVAGTGSTKAREAMEKLCEGYWYPLYAYVRRRGHSPADAQDLTQAFFARLIERGLVAEADPNRGRFRSFLLTSLKNFLNDEWSKARADKRGGGRLLLSLDDRSAEDRYQLEPACDSTAEQIYERRWAMALLEQTLARLEADYASAGKKKLFDELHPTILGEKRSLTYAAIGVRLGMTEGAVKIAAHRLVRRYREMIRDETAKTVADPREIEDEIRRLFAVLM